MSLSEVNTKFVQQADPGLHKRWFADDEVDLTVWQEDTGAITHFQFVLCGRDMIEWDQLRGVRLGVLQDSRESGVKGARTYVLKSVPDSRTLNQALREFERQSDELDPRLRAFVLGALGEPLGIEFRPPAPSEERHRLVASPPAAAPVLPTTLETAVLSIRLMTPYRIKQALEEHAAQGWELLALGGNVALFQRDVGGERIDTTYDIRSITLRLPHQIKALLNSSGGEGRKLGGVGPNFAFFKRAHNRPHKQREFDMDSITLSTVRDIDALLDRRGRKRWALTGMGKNFAFFERTLRPEEGPPGWEHKSLRFSTLTMIPALLGKMVERLNCEIAEGWRPCALRAGYVFLRRPSSGEPQV
ncbi:MAG: hypothetical protein HY303_09830 [Candidatus Wallbacteria bacterium]|nr:hypothetical protein [Candidatus Wallbacteria bacterium]